MKYLCVACERLGEVSGFRLEAGALVLTCARCQAESRTAPAPRGSPAVPRGPDDGELRASAFGDAAAIVDPFEVPPGLCPKCIAPRSDDAVCCASCGLTFGLLSAEELRPGEALAGQWQALLSTWAEPEAHDRLLSRAVLSGELSAVGRLYRLHLAHAPSDLLAVRGREEVLRLAALPASPEGRSTHDERTAPWKYLVVLALMLASLAMVFVLARKLFFEDG